MDIKRTILRNYFSITEEQDIPMYLQTKYQPTSFHSDYDQEGLWKLHHQSLENHKISEIKPNQSLLDLKVHLAQLLFSQCRFCEHSCLVDRKITSGWCGIKNACVSSEFLHGGEEDVLVPSHTIFFSGCTLRCVFCQNWDISQQMSGLSVEPKQMAKIINKRAEQGSKNVNWVGGDPTPNIPYILNVLRHLETPLPQIWNSNMYCSVETMNLLNGVIDVYLTDFKFGNNHCAKRLANIDNYFEIIKRNHQIAYGNGEMIIRHLVLPNHVECCSKPVIDWISQYTPEALVNIMGQYRPEYHASNHPDISRLVSSQEMQEVKDYSKEKGLYLIE